MSDPVCSPACDSAPIDWPWVFPPPATGQEGETSHLVQVPDTCEDTQLVAVDGSTRTLVPY